MKNDKIFLKTLISAIYPNKCICCGEILDEGVNICNSCNDTIERANLDKICTDCGFEKENCVCKHNVYRFSACVCAFKNIGIARKAYYAYKFGKKQRYADFFAEEVCSAIKYCYSDINFDIVCSVLRHRRFEYDHSGYIAALVAKKLKLPFDGNLLHCLKKGKKQHKSTIEERLRNVEGKYGAFYRVDSKNILLIDDIKTMGATLDECARVLLFAGAENVYCATVLGSARKDKTKIEK